MLFYSLTSLFLFAGALLAVIFNYDFLNKFGAHGVAIVALIFLATFLIGATLTLSEVEKPKRPLSYVRYLGFIVGGFTLVFGAIWLVRKTIWALTMRYLPAEYEGVGQVVFIIAFLGIVFLIIRNADRIVKKFSRK